MTICTEMQSSYQFAVTPSGLLGLWVIVNPGLANSASPGLHAIAPSGHSALRSSVRTSSGERRNLCRFSAHPHQVKVKPMSKLAVFNSVTLDGYFAGENGGFS